MSLVINGVTYEKKTAVYSWDVTAAEGAVSKTVTFSGDAHIHSYWIDLPDWTNVIATNLKININEGVIFDSGDLVAVEGAESTGLVNRIVDETGGTFEVSLSGDTGNTGALKIQFFFDVEPQREIYSSQQ